MYLLSIRHLLDRLRRTFSPSVHSLRARLVSGGAWCLAGTAASQVGNLAAGIIGARLLGKESFGAIGLVQSTISMIGVIAGPGVGLTATRYVAQLRSTDPERAARVLQLTRRVAWITAGITSALIVLFAPQIAVRTLKAPGLTNAIRLGGLLLLVQTLDGVQSAALSGFEAFRSLALVNVIRMVVLPGAIAIGATYARLTGAIVGLIAAAVITYAINWRLLAGYCRRAGLRRRTSNCWAELRVVWTFSIPAFLGATLVTPVLWVGSALLARQPGGLAELAVYNAASQWRGAIMFLPAVLGQLTFPFLSHFHGAGDRGRYRRLLGTNYGLVALCTLLVGAVLVCASPWLMRAYGRGYAGGTTVLAILAYATVLNAVSGVTGQAIASAANMWWGVLLNLIWAVVLISTAYVAVPAWGSVGLAAALAVAYTVHAVTSAVYAFWALRGSRRIPPSSAPLVPSCAIGSAEP